MMRITRTFQHFTIILTLSCLLQDIYSISQPTNSIFLPLVTRDRYIGQRGSATYSGKNRLSSRRPRQKTSGILVGRRQLEELPSYLPQKVAVPKSKANLGEPSCYELRSMWRQLKRLSRQSELTNEIPQIIPGTNTNSNNPMLSMWVPPAAYNSSTRRPFRSRYRSKQSKNKYKNYQSRRKQKLLRQRQRIRQRQRQRQQKPKVGFGKFYNDRFSFDTQRPWKPVRHNSKNGIEAVENRFINDRQFARQSTNDDNSRYYGTFVDVPIPEENLGAYGTMVYSPSDKMRNKYKNRRLSLNRRYRNPSYPPSELYGPQYEMANTKHRPRYRNSASSLDSPADLMNRRLSRQPEYMSDERRIEDDNRKIDEIGFGSFVDNDQGCINGKCGQMLRQEDGPIIDEFGIWHNNPVVISSLRSSSRNKRPISDLIGTSDDVSSTNL